jgi:hypothetical protein
MSKKRFVMWFKDNNESFAFEKNRKGDLMQIDFRGFGGRI